MANNATGSIYADSGSRSQSVIESDPTLRQGRARKKIGNSKRKILKNISIMEIENIADVLPVTYFAL